MNRKHKLPMRVLIVDANPLDRADAKAALLKGSRRLYEFTDAATAEEALALCSRQPWPDCIVLDLALPDVDPLEVFERLPRDDDNLLSIPVVVLDASVGIGLHRAALRAGAQEYVGKAWLMPETLTLAVENAIERLGMARSSQHQRYLADLARARAFKRQGENRRPGKVEFFPETFDLAGLVTEVQDTLHAEMVRKRLRFVDGLVTVPADGMVADRIGRRLLAIHAEVDDSPRLVAGLTAAGFSVDAMATGAQAIENARRREYDAITLGLLLPDQCGLRVLQRIRADGPCRDLPVVGLTMRAQAGQAATFAIADVLSKPIRTDEIVTAMARHLSPGTRPGKVMVIDDDPIALALMRTTLEAVGIDAVCLPDGRSALRGLDELRPDAIILDLVMPDFDGFAVLDALRQEPLWCDTPVFVWTSMQLSDAAYASLSDSACAILSRRGSTMETTLDALRKWQPGQPSRAAGIHA